ncbi:MAG: hypothetical protein ACO3KE_03040 [Ilumatobacteraceae bacterium]|jgi:hypothetical protein
MKLLTGGVHDQAGRCRKSSARSACVGTLLAVLLASCATTPRTATNFCRVLADRLDGITQTPTSSAQVQELIGHYDRLVEVAPIEVEDDLATIRNLFVLASEVDVTDAASVQAVADASYAAERAADDAGVYVGATCGVDLSNGFAVQAPTPTPETIPATTP